MATLETLVGNVEKIRKFVQVYLDIPVLNDKQRNALAIDLVQLDKNLASLAAFKAVSVPFTVVKSEEFDEVPAETLTYDEEHEIFIDADDAALMALGRPYGHGSDERGALPLQTHLAMAKELGLPLHVAEFEMMIDYHNAQGANIR